MYVILIHKGLAVSNTLFEFADVEGCYSENKVIGTGVFIFVWSVERTSVQSLTSN